MPLLPIIEVDVRKRLALLDAMARDLPLPQARVDGALQIRIQTTFARFWQERLVSLVEPDAPLVRDLLLKKKFLLQSSHRVEHEALVETDAGRLDEALSLFDISATLLERKLTSLSNGELRRLLLARAFMENPKSLVLDDPLGGLDPVHRLVTEHALQTIADLGITVLWAHAGEGEREQERRRGMERLATAKHAGATEGTASEVLVRMENAGVRFGDTVIFENLDWTICAGEHWALSGPNGSGKSSLLAFLTADHPQLYRNHIELLGKRPGQGLAVWEHKKHCGFCSPELHHQWRGNEALIDVIASGFLDPRDPSGEVLREDRRIALRVAQTLGLPEDLHFQEAAYVQQRLALVARALVKHPRLLILDEPDQGLGDEERGYLFRFLDEWLANANTTLVLATHHALHLPHCITHRLYL